MMEDQSERSDMPDLMGSTPHTSRYLSDLVCTDLNLLKLADQIMLKSNHCKKIQMLRVRDWTSGLVVEVEILKIRHEHQTLITHLKMILQQ